MKFSFMPYDAMILSGNYECSMWHFGKTVMHKLIMNRNWNDNKKKETQLMIWNAAAYSRDSFQQSDVTNWLSISTHRNVSPS